MTSEFVAPDRQHLIMSQGGQTLGEYFLIGNTMYVKSGRDCSKLPQKITLPNPPEHMQPDPDAVIQVARGGAEAVDGTPTQTYAVTITSQGKTVRQKMYAATATGLLRRLEVSSNEGPLIIDRSHRALPLLQSHAHPLKGRILRGFCEHRSAGDQGASARGPRAQDHPLPVIAPGSLHRGQGLRGSAAR